MAEPSIKASVRTLDEVLEDEDAALSLRSYLHSIGSAQYLSFLIEVELLLMIDDAEQFQIQTRCQQIFNKYIVPGAQYELLIDEATRQRIQSLLRQSSKRMYCELLSAVRNSLEQHHLPKYVRSDAYRRMIHEKNLQHHAMLRKPKLAPVETRPTKEKEVLFFRLLRVFGVKDKESEKTKPIITRTDRADTVAMIHDLLQQKSAQSSGSTPPFIHSPVLSRVPVESISPSSSPPHSPNEAGSPRSNSPASPSPPPPSMSEQSRSTEPVTLERPLFESQYMLMPPLDLEISAPQPRQARTPTVLALEHPLPILPVLSAPTAVGAATSQSQNVAIKRPDLDPSFPNAYADSSSPASVSSGSNIIGSPARDSTFVRSAPSILARSPTTASVSPPSLSFSAGVLPLKDNLRQPTHFTTTTIVEPMPRSTSPRIHSFADFDAWKVYLSSCGIPAEDVPACAELITRAGIMSDRIGTVTQGALTAAGMKVGYVLRIIKKQRDDVAAAASSSSSTTTTTSVP